MRKEKDIGLQPLIVLRGQPGNVKDSRNEWFGYGLGSKKHDERESENGEEVSANN